LIAENKVFFVASLCARVANLFKHGPDQAFTRPYLRGVWAALGGQMAYSKIQ